MYRMTFHSSIRVQLQETPADWKSAKKRVIAISEIIVESKNSEYIDVRQTMRSNYVAQK